MSQVPYSIHHESADRIRAVPFRQSEARPRSKQGPVPDRVSTQPSNHRWSVPALAAAAMAMIGAVVAGSLAPFRFHRSMPLAADWFGLGLIGWPETPVSDVVTNVAVYVPIGGLVFLLAGALRCRAVRSGAWAFGAGSLLSVSMEWIQTMTWGRVASWTDVVMNGIGTLVGVAAVCAFNLVRGRLADRWRSKPAATAAGVLTVGLVVYHLLPFDVVTSREQFRVSLSQCRFRPLYGDGGTVSTAELLTWIGLAGQFAVLGMLYAAAAAERGGVMATAERGAVMVAAARRSIVTVVVTALTIEVCQIFVASHALDGLDVIAGASGGFLGIVAGTRVWQKGGVAAGRSFWGWVVAGQVLYLAAGSAVPFDLSWDHVQVERLWHWPLSAQVSRPFGPAMSDLAAVAAASGCLAVTMRLWLGRRGGRFYVIMVPAVVIGVGCVCQFLQLLSATRYPDATDVLLGGCASLAVALWPARGMSAFPVSWGADCIGSVNAAEPT